MQKAEQFYPKTEKEWRKWLENNYNKEKIIAVVRYKKHTGKPSPSHHALMREAICFGWIDTTAKRLDDERYIVHFVRRNEKTSKWSDNTLRYAQELIREGKMHPHGLHLYKIGKSKPVHDAGIPKNPDTPKEIKELIEKNNLRENYQSLAPSTKRIYLRWYLRAKQEETKKKRAKKILEALKSNKDIF